MELKNGNYCPLIKKECIGLQCAWFTLVRGTNPNTGKEVDEWACAVAWLPVLLIENSQQQRGTGEGTKGFLAHPNENEQCDCTDQTAPENHF